MTLSDLAALTGLGWDTVKDIVKARLEKDYGHPRLKELKRLSIDEIYVGRRKKFYTLVIDLDTGRVVWVAHGRGGDTLRKFWRALRLSKARIEAVSLDMSPAYSASVAEHLPAAAIVFDRFHIAKLVNEKLDDCGGDGAGSHRPDAADRQRLRKAADVVGGNCAAVGIPRQFSAPARPPDHR